VVAILAVEILLIAVCLSGSGGVVLATSR